jgi:hypothetical protein
MKEKIKTYITQCMQILIFILLKIYHIFVKPIKFNLFTKVYVNIASRLFFGYVINITFKRRLFIFFFPQYHIRFIDSNNLEKVIIVSAKQLYISDIWTVIEYDRSHNG